MAFKPSVDYQIIPESMDIKDFSEYRDEYVTRPPYQRKTVWSAKKKQSLLDSFIRGYYIPKVVLRVVDMGEDKEIYEVIDGQQRITTIQNFFDDEIDLPKSLASVSKDLPGKKYSQLDVEKRRYVDKIKVGIDKIIRIENANNAEHQRLATEIFWRLQQGESLNQMEIAHARLSSLARNFLVKYADDQTFDFDNYKPIDDNDDKLSFFKLLNRPNDRMQHLSLLARFLLIEKSNGPADLKDSEVVDLIDSTLEDGGISNNTYENEPHAKAVISCLRHLTRIFDNDPMAKDGDKIKELKPDYVVISLYMLFRYLRNNYVVEASHDDLLHRYFVEFHEQWRNAEMSDPLMIEFAKNRQHSTAEVQRRSILMRNHFFDWLAVEGLALKAKDDRRSYNEATRISLYRRDKGMCQKCLADGKPPKDSEVSWSEYEADHVLPHSKGGKTELANAQLLCRDHNRSKSNSI